MSSSDSESSEGLRWQTPRVTSTPAGVDRRGILSSARFPNTVEGRKVTYRRGRKVQFEMSEQDEGENEREREMAADIAAEKEREERQEILDSIGGMTESEKLAAFIRGWRSLKPEGDLDGLTEDVRDSCIQEGARISIGQRKGTIEYINYADMTGEQVREMADENRKIRQVLKSLYPEVFGEDFLDRPPQEEAIDNNETRSNEKSPERTTKRPTPARGGTKLPKITSRASTSKSQASAFKGRARRSSMYGARQDSGSESSFESEEEVAPVMQKRKSTNRSTASLFNHSTTMPISGAYPIQPMMVAMTQQRSLRSFDGHPSTDAAKFLREYEKVASGWPDNTKLDQFCQYLEGAASDWLEILEHELRNTRCTNNGVESNRWAELKWERLRRLFQKEFVKETVGELVSCRQQPQESGTRHFFRMCRLHINARVELGDTGLKDLIIERMEEPYKTHFEQRTYNTIEELRVAIRLYDSKRRKILAKKALSKRKSEEEALIALVGLDRRQSGTDNDDSEGSEEEIPLKKQKTHKRESIAKAKEGKQEKVTAQICAMISQAANQMVPYQSGSQRGNYNNNRGGSRPQQGQYANYECYGCGQLGHVKRDCKNFQRQGERGSWRGRGSGRGYGRGRGGRGYHQYSNNRGGFNQNRYNNNNQERNTPALLPSNQNNQQDSPRSNQGNGNRQ